MKGDKDGRWRVRRSTTVPAQELASPNSATSSTVTRARGGVSLWAVLSGVFVAFGASVVVLTLASAVLAATGIAEDGIRPNELRTVSLGAAVGLLLAQFVSYLWGGYTAGRMGRGSGLMNGALVAVAGTVIVVFVGSLIGAVARSQGPNDHNVQALALPLGQLGDVVTGIGIVLLIVMFAGGAIGGRIGMRWHTKLENAQLRKHLPQP